MKCECFQCRCEGDLLLIDLNLDDILRGNHGSIICPRTCQTSKC